MGNYKRRLDHFMSDRGMYILTNKLPLDQQAYPTLYRIAEGIPSRKFFEWNFSDEYYHARFQEIRLCLYGLIGHGACLAAQGETVQLPALRDFIGGLAVFWPDPQEEKDDPQERESKYTGLFDKAVSKAQSGSEVPPLSAERKKNILIGLENYIIDAVGQGGMEYALETCESIAVQLRESWKEEQVEKQAQQFGQTFC